MMENPKGWLEQAMDKLEPIAQQFDCGAMDGVGLSQAISLKRIADALEKAGALEISGELCATVEDIQHEEIRFASIAERIANAFADKMLAVLKEPLNAYGEGIGECIQGQMGRGNAGIR